MATTILIPIIIASHKHVKKTFKQMICNDLIRFLSRMERIPEDIFIGISACKGAIFIAKITHLEQSS